MNIKRAKQEIKDAIRAYLERNQFGEYMIPVIRQRPILLIGPPGIGKTQIMEQISQECEIALVAYTITHHTRQSAIGLPFIKEKEFGGKSYSITEYTMSEIIASVYEKIEETGIHEGILFIDEINCVSETLAPTMLQFLQCKTFGNQKIPDGWTIVAAGNPPEYNKSVREFDVVTLDRVKKIDVEEDFEVWKEFAYKEGIHGAVVSYLDIKKGNFYQIETTIDGKTFATARGWQDLSELIHVYEKLNMTIDQEVVHQYIQHVKIAKDFTNYLELYYKYKTDYQVDEILKGHITKGALEKLKFAPFDEKLSVIGLLLSRLGEEFQMAYTSDFVTTELYEKLKTFKMELEMTGESVPAEKISPQEIFMRLTEDYRSEIEHKCISGQLEKTKEHMLLQAADHMEKYAKILNAEGTMDEGTAFEQVRVSFQEEVEKRKNIQNEAQEKLEYAFDFMEAAFGESQEMVVFITELTVHYYCAWFISGNGCDRYYKYNKSLLFRERQQSILNDIEEVQTLMNG